MGGREIYLMHPLPQSPAKSSAIALTARTKAALEKMGFQKLTEIQLESIGAIAGGRDVVARSPTGTGKTAAFLIPIIEKIISLEEKEKEKIGEKNSSPQTSKKQAAKKALVLEPSRELAIQAANECRKLAEGSEVRCVAAYGGTPPERQEQLISNGSQVVIGTPGRVKELMQRGVLKPGEYAFLVLDEADRLLAEQFEKDVLHIASRFPRQRQTLLFSVQMPAGKLKLALHLLKKDFAEIKVGKVAGETVKHFYMVAENKPRALAEMLKKAGEKTLVFCTTAESAGQLKRDLKFHGVGASVFHSQVSSHRRQEVVKKFKQIHEENYFDHGEILIATDVAARGMHFPKVKRIVSYELPSIPEFYLHRAGRTGRMGEQGECVSIVSENELPKLRKILSFCGVEAKKKI